MSLDEIARLRFEKDENTRNTRNSYEYSSIDKPQDINLAIDLMKEISTDVVLFVNVLHDPKLIKEGSKTISSNYIVISNYGLTDEEVMEIYNEFSDPSFAGG